MAAPTLSPPATIADYEALDDPSGYELIDGVLKERHVSLLANYVAGNIFFSVKGHSRVEGGHAFGENVELAIDPARPNTLLYKADGAWVAPGRIQGELPYRGYMRIPPDLVVEVISPTNSAAEVEAKLRDYLRLGVRMVWVVFPDIQAVSVYRPDGTTLRLEASDRLSGEDVLSGFEVSVSEFFRP
ncbi:hypothetical protein AYO38_03005 [bacterium SCGC AG-212-C10]|nr:hypothetical protein AYO38_03005 [bacterium SCGC AG-212-C10]